jgi:pyridoxamine 5'-phosphate oxidase family protein
MPATASVFNEAELAYLQGERRLARIATVGRDGTPHVVPVGMRSYNPEHDTIDVTGRDFEQTKKFRDVARTGRAAIVIDDLASIDPWRPRAIAGRGDPRPAITHPNPLRAGHLLGHRGRAGRRTVRRGRQSEYE